MKLLIVAVALAALAAPRPVTESAQWGNVRATFTYTYDPDAEPFPITT